MLLLLLLLSRFSCVWLGDPIDSSAPGSPIPGVLQARTLEWTVISFNAWKWKVNVKSLNHVWLLATPRTAAYQALPSMGFPRRVLEWGAIAFSDNDHEMAPKHGQICGFEGALLTGSWPLPIDSTKIKSWLLQDADLQHPLERSSGWRGKDKALQKPKKTGLQIVRCFQVKIFMNPNSCIFSYLEKHYCHEPMSGPGSPA